MNISQDLQKTAAEYPERKPGSTALQEVINGIKKETAAWEFQPQAKKSPVFHLQVSILVFAIGSLLAIGISFIRPLSGLILEGILFLLFVLDLAHPVLAKLKPSQTENLLLTIPARSKESQRLIITTGIATDSFTTRLPWLGNRIYLSLIYGLGFMTLLLMAGHWVWKLPLLLYFSLPAILIVLALTILAGEDIHAAGLANCSVLLELGAILLKARPSATTVTLYFTGANSLNSGVSGIPKMLKDGPELSYVIDLVDFPDKRINMVTTDGLILPQQSDPLLVEMLMEVAKEKAIPVQAIKLSELSPAYALKLKKVKAITITNPLDPPDAAKNLRELLLGLIRKLD